MSVLFPLSVQLNGSYSLRDRARLSEKSCWGVCYYVWVRHTEAERRILKSFHRVFCGGKAEESQHWVFGEPQVPCYFIFGDSLVDNGNNNRLPTTTKANYKPYGIDFPHGTTGRFSNGRNIADFIAELLDFPNYIPPFKDTIRGSNILQGVNYASGAAGIRFETGRAQGKVISLDQQLKNHDYTISQINGLLRNNSATSAYLKSCLYMVVIGNNDYLNNYFLPFPYSTTSIRFTPQEYAIALNRQLSSQLKSLYGQGARKIAIFGGGLLGCTPYAIARFNTQGSPCVGKINNAVQLYNVGLKSQVEDLNNNLTDAKFIFVDTYKISMIDTSNQGGIIFDAPCCEVPPYGSQCAPFGRVCANRTNYIFWDGVHPTEVGQESLASRAYNAQSPNDTYPFDISHLAQLPLE
ncbi:GDSL esterase/lipase At1g29670-like [Momordica charantia]|uniref:GDSL esterase/lipase At1g29670-like n=1 Tax=Momordica charantia TaxID=3673 RepID=A0A6J1CTC1_MOMCH|nr:GDSL esterase/lipase At1g29670-like [Momordica charantia]